MLVALASIKRQLEELESKQSFKQRLAIAKAQAMATGRVVKV